MMSLTTSPVEGPNPFVLGVCMYENPASNRVVSEADEERLLCELRKDQRLLRELVHDVCGKAKKAQS
jgi:hypothetical protein